MELISVSKDDFNKYLIDNFHCERSLKLKFQARRLKQAKELIRLQENLIKRQFRQGEVVYREGDTDNKSMYVVDQGTLKVEYGKETVHKLQSGDTFGESGLLFQRPRSSTVTCASERCNLHEMRGADFQALLKSDPAHARALSDMCRKRMFLKALKRYLLSKSSDLKGDELVKALENAGSLSLDEVRDMMLHMGSNSAIPEKDVDELLKSLDLNEDGQVFLNDILDMNKGEK